MAQRGCNPESQTARRRGQGEEGGHGIVLDHRWLLRAWLLVYAFVGIQMGWLLRPFVGDPNSPTHFFREKMWGNAYEVVARMIWHAVVG